MRTSWIFMARSTAAAVNTIGTSLVADGCILAAPNSGHFTCSRERTDHVLSTYPIVDADSSPAVGYPAAHGDAARRSSCLPAGAPALRGAGWGLRRCVRVADLHLRGRSSPLLIHRGRSASRGVDE